MLILDTHASTPGKTYGIKFGAVFEAIHELMTPADPKKKRPIGFAPWEKKHY